MEFRDYKPTFLPCIHSKTGLLSSIGLLLAQHTRTRAHNTRASYSFFYFFAVTSVTAAPKTHIHFQRNNTSFVVKQHVVCGKTTRRL